MTPRDDYVSEKVREHCECGGGSRTWECPVHGGSSAGWWLLLNGAADDRFRREDGLPLGPGERVNRRTGKTEYSAAWL